MDYFIERVEGNVPNKISISKTNKETKNNKKQQRQLRHFGEEILRMRKTACAKALLEKGPEMKLDWREQ